MKTEPNRPIRPRIRLQQKGFWKVEELHDHDGKEENGPDHS